MADIQRLGMPVEPGLELGAIVDLKDADTGAVVDGCERVEALSGPRDALEFGCKLTRCFVSRDVHGKLLLFWVVL